MKLLRVAWICHFSNVEIQNRINPKKKINEFAPWITKGIEEVKKRDDIELFVVSPHRWIDKEVNFTEDNIHYYFFNSGIPYYGRHWPGFFRLDLLTNFSVNKWKVKRIINRIKPDIIHLHGIENSYYSSTILQFINKYPILATVQGFISHQISKDKLVKNLARGYLLKKKYYAC